MKLPKMLGDRFGILRAGVHNGCNRNGGDVDTLFLQASKETMRQRANACFADTK